MKETIFCDVTTTGKTIVNLKPNFRPDTVLSQSPRLGYVTMLYYCDMSIVSLILDSESACKSACYSGHQLRQRRKSQNLSIFQSTVK